MHDVAVIDQAEVARIALEPIRTSILRQLSQPGSASSVAAALDLPRQKVNYHLRLLEEHGLVELVEERPRRGLTERIVAATAAAYAIAPDALGDCRADPADIDQLSSSYLIALGARLVGEVGSLARQAREANKPLATLSIDTELIFASRDARAAFAEELATAVAGLVARFHDEDAPDGRRHRLVVGAHPIEDPTPEEEGSQT